MDIDFIKWMVGYAEGYIIIEDRIFYGGCYFNDAEDLWGRELHRYNLLQRAIEGVNRHNIKYYIIQNNGSCSIHEGFKKILSYGSNFDIDQTKESALKYIYEQE